MIAARILEVPSPHYDLAVLSKSGGYSATGRLAYIERGGEYKSRADEVAALGAAGPDLGDWTCVDRAEYRANAAVLYEVTVAIPHMLPQSEWPGVMQTHATYLWETLALPSRWAAHGRGKWDERNGNGHIILPMRTVSEDGRLSMQKATSLQRKYGGRVAVAAMRAHWMDTCNAALARCGRNERVDLRTLAAQGIDRPAQVRLPRRIYEAARRGEIESPIYDRNRKLAELKHAQEARANAAAANLRDRRAAGITVVFLGRALRASRRTARRRNMDQTHSSTRHPRGRYTRDPRNRVRNHEESEDGRRNGDALLAGEGFADQRIAGRAAGLDHGGTASRDWCGGPQIDEEMHLAGTPPALERDAKDADRDRVNTRAVPHTTDDEKVAPQTEIGQTDANRNGDLERIAASALPLVSIHTSTGGVFYARRAYFLAAIVDGRLDIELCGDDGEPLTEYRTRLRVSTVLRSGLTPIDFPLRAVPDTAGATSESNEANRPTKETFKATCAARISNSSWPLVRMDTQWESYYARREDWVSAFFAGAASVPLCDVSGTPVIGCQGQVQMLMEEVWKCTLFMAGNVEEESQDPQPDAMTHNQLEGPAESTTVVSTPAIKRGRRR